MNFTQRDRLALRSAMSKPSASASAMAEASREIDALVSRMDTTEQPGRTAVPLVDAAPTQTQEVSSGAAGGTSVAATPPVMPPVAPPVTSPAAPPQPTP